MQHFVPDELEFRQSLGCQFQFSKMLLDCRLDDLQP